MTIKGIPIDPSSGTLQIVVICAMLALAWSAVWLGRTAPRVAVGTRWPAVVLLILSGGLIATHGDEYDKWSKEKYHVSVHDKATLASHAVGSPNRTIVGRSAVYLLQYHFRNKIFVVAPGDSDTADILKAHVGPKAVEYAPQASTSSKAADIELKDSGVLLQGAALYLEDLTRYADATRVGLYFDKAQERWVLVPLAS